VLNAWEVEKDRLFANNEIHDIAVAIGVDPHGPADEPDLTGLRCGKVCILSDADVDGSHPGAAADAVLPPLPQAHRARAHPSPSRRSFASTRRRAAGEI
jgi:hypothetical protein